MTSKSLPYILIQGAGDLASGVALRLYRAGLRVLMTEISTPLAVRRLVSFAEAVYQGRCMVEDVEGVLIENPSQAETLMASEKIPVLVDPAASVVSALPPQVLVDARMVKRTVPSTKMALSPLVLGLGPGFIPGTNCHAVVETMRGHMLGRVYWDKPAQEDTGVPDSVVVGDKIYREERVLRAPVSGRLRSFVEIGDLLEAGSLIAQVGEKMVTSPFKGVLRGLVRGGITVEKGMKIGDVDPRSNPKYCRFVSDKSLAVGGGVLEAVLSEPVGQIFPKA